MKEHKSVHKKSARLKRRCLAVMLVVCMVISIFPMIQLQNVYAGESFTISLTKVEQNTEIDATHFRPWNISISGNGSYTGTFYVIFGAAAGEEAARAYIKSNGIKFEEKTKIAGFDANIITNSSDDGGEHLMIMVTVTAPKTAQEIQNYLNNNISFVHNGITNANTMAAALKNWTYVPAINENTYVQPAEVTFSHTNGAGNESGNTGSGKVILNYGITSVELKQGTTANVPKDTSVTVKIQPTRSIDADTDSYVTGYKITGGNVNIEKNNLTSQKDYEETITATADMTISVVFEKKGNQPTAATNRPQGNLAWAKNIATNADVSYVDALKMSYNASVQNYILNSNFGTSWTYGVDLLANPKVYSTVSFNGGTPITVGAKDAFKDLGQLGGQYPTKNVQLGSNIKKTDIKPGLFTQTVESDYYTATGICSNHWYHVVGVEYHKDGMTRSFNILKDTLLITDVDSTYVYGSDVGAAVKAASEGIEGSQAIIDTQKVHKVFKDSNGNVVLDITKALPGNYTVEFTYDGDDFIQTYTSGLSKGFTITKAANTADAIAPMFTKTEKSITLANLYDGQLYSIDGTNWYTKAEIEANNPFVNLNEGTAYTVSTKIAATDTHEESAVNSSTSVTTDIMISGKINGEAAALPAVVTVSDGKNTYTVTTDNEGNYSKAVPAGVYSISVEGKDGLQNGTYTGTFNVSKDSKAVPAISMTDTAKGKARKFISENLGEGKDTITEVTADTLDKILNSKAKFDALTDPAVKAAINEWMNNLTNSDKTYEKLAEEANDFLNKTSDKFIKDHMTDAKGKVITEATKENFASILGGENDFNALTQKQKDDVNKKLKAAGAKPDTYEALLALAKQKVNENSDTFIKKYVSDKNNKVYVEATDENYEQILSGKDDWNLFSQTEKNAINAKLVKAGSKKYEELLKTTEALKAVNDKAESFISGLKTNGKYDNAKIIANEAAWNKLTANEQARVNELLGIDDKVAKTTYGKLLDAANAGIFINKYLTDKSGNIYTEADKDNYEHILSGKDDWDKMSEAEKANVNAKLSPETYESLLLKAQEIKDKLDESNAKTGDDSNMFIWIVLMLVSCCGAGAAVYGKKTKVNR